VASTVLAVILAVSDRREPETLSPKVPVFGSLREHHRWGYAGLGS
jgi:hypothetical protein